MFGFFKKKTFEDEITALQADMVDICNEYSCGAADKIFIYVAYEGLLFAMHFHIINNKILMPGKLNDSELDINFDVSDECQEQVLDILNEDVKKIKSVCDKYNQPMPTEMRLTYEVRTKKFSAEYKYEKQTSDNVSVFDNADAWFEEEKAKLESEPKRDETKKIEDLYKDIGMQLNDTIDSDWDVIQLNIECSDKYIGTNAKYKKNGKWKNSLHFSIDADTKIALIKFHNSAEALNFAPWNRAVYTLEKSGHFDMAFEWDQALQDEWDKA